MGICKTVKSLAEAIAAAAPPNSSRDRLCVEMLRLMPMFSDVNNLAVWEVTYRKIPGFGEATSLSGKLLDELYEWATDNAYGAIDWPGTGDQYSALVKSLETHGVKIPPLESIESLREW